MRSESSGVNAGSDCEPGFRGVISASFGATDALANHDTGDRPRHDLRFGSADPVTLSDIRSVLGRSHVGVRLVLAGPLADIRAAAAVAAECGLQGDEVTLLDDEVGPRVVYCPHCRTTTTVEAADSEVDCQGCATALTITDHFSRRMGAYLGYSAHVEEAARP